MAREEGREARDRRSVPREVPEPRVEPPGRGAVDALLQSEGPGRLLCCGLEAPVALRGEGRLGIREAAVEVVLGKRRERL